MNKKILIIGLIIIGIILVSGWWIWDNYTSVMYYGYRCKANEDCVVKEDWCLHKNQPVPMIEIMVKPWAEGEKCECIDNRCKRIYCEDQKLVTVYDSLTHQVRCVEKQEITEIELYRCGEPSPRWVNLPVNLPIDTEGEAQIIANACLKKAMFKDQPVKIVEEKNIWYLEGPIRQGLDYPFWSMTINKDSGKTEYLAVK